MTQTNIEWLEVNCIIEALQALVDRYRAALAVDGLDDDARADLSNDLSYALILRGKYEDIREAMRGT